MSVNFSREIFTLTSFFLRLAYEKAHDKGVMDNSYALHGRVLLNNYCQTAKGKKIDYYKRLLKMLDGHYPFVELSYDCKLEEDSWCYLNFLKVPGAVLLPLL